MSAVQPGEIHIACQADHRFTPDCGVMLRSLLSVNAGRKFHVHFLHHPDLPAGDLQDLADLVGAFGAKWSPLAIPDERMRGFPCKAHYGGYAACYRLLLPELLPDVSRVLYLDADILHVDRLDELWATDLCGHCVAAVTNPLFTSMHERIRSNLGVEDPAAYFNSGVLLLDLERLRNSGLGRALVEFAVGATVPLPWPDQDTLNAVLWQHRLPLSPRWNAMTGLFMLPRRLMAWDQKTVSAARRSPAIIHFVGGYKPSHYRFKHPYRRAYLAQLQATVWKDRPIEGRTLLNQLLRPLPLIWQWRLDKLVAALRRVTA